MPQPQVTVEAHTLEPDGRTSIRVRAPWLDSVRPGQVFTAFRPGLDWHGRTLIPTRIATTGFSAHLPETALWPPGTSLVLRGPFGRGFNPPPSSRRWLLIALGAANAYLRPLIRMGLDQSCEVALVTEETPRWLPPAVEILSDPDDGLRWADYIAVAGEYDQLDVLLSRLESGAWPLRKLADDEVLFSVPIPCGMGGCQACVFDDRAGRRLACVDGPVVKLLNLRG